MTESKDPLAYWRKLKQRLKAEGNETVTNCHGLKLRAADGKMRMTDVATAEQMFRVIQSIPSPKAEPFKMWMAKVAAETARPYGGASNGINVKRSRRPSGRSPRDVPLYSTPLLPLLKFFKWFCRDELSGPSIKNKENQYPQ